MEKFKPGRFIDPFTDWGFKRLFGSEPHKELLIDFLNQLFWGEREIIDLVYNKNEHPGELAEDRKSVFDLLCTGANGEQFIIEVQRVYQEFFKDRCLYYTSSLIREQALVGSPKWTYQLKPVFLIGLMDFCFDDSHRDKFLHRIQLTTRDTGEVFYDKLGFIFIEMPKFEKTASELSSELDNWFYLLKNLSKLKKIPLFLRKPIFSKLFNIAEVSNLTKDEKMAYDQSLKAQWDYYNSLDYVEKKGFERGIKEGVEEGIAEGIYQEKLNNARAMKRKGISNQLIAEITGLSAEQIEVL